MDKSTIFTSRRAFVGFITTVLLIVVNLFDLPFTPEEVELVSSVVTVLGLALIAGYSLEDFGRAIFAGKNINEIILELEDAGDELFGEDEEEVVG